MCDTVAPFLYTIDCAVCTDEICILSVNVEHRTVYLEKIGI